MPSRLADRLKQVRHNNFVGRSPECNLFEATLNDSAACRVLHISGPGGIGKTTLLQEFAALCPTNDACAVPLDGREIEPSPQNFEYALSQALGTEEKALDFLSRQARRHVLLIDTYERLTPLDNWLRETFLPQLPDCHRVVLAGRNSPRPAWKMDGGWSSLLCTVPLRNLNREESHDFLHTRHVPADQHNRVLDFTHGHPLALSLVADVFDQQLASGTQNTVFDPQNAPDMVQLLVSHLVQEVPTATHRAALEACALVRWTTEPLLSHLLDLKPDQKPDSAALFEWLLSLSLIETGAQGLSPHDLAREALVANLRWRNPQAYADYHRRARTFYATQLGRVSPREQQRVLADYIYLHHDNSVIRPFLEWQENGDLSAAVARPDELPQLIEMVRRHEGEDSAQLADFWFARQAENVLVLRGDNAEVQGFLFSLALHGTTEEERNCDPAVQGAWEYLQQTAPLRRGEGATMFRFWMTRDGYQSVSSAQSLIFVNIVRHYLTTPGLAFSFLPVADADFWAPAFGYAGATRLPQVDFQSGEKRFGVFCHDWRLVPPLAWLDQMAEQEIAATASLESSTRLAPTQAEVPLLLSEEEFGRAVREALKQCSRPGSLEANPLLRSRLVLEHAAASDSDAEKAIRLQVLLRQSCELLCGAGRADKWYQALRWRYLEPQATQEAAAEQMDVPFSTFRRYLKSGVESVVETLWQQETREKKPLF